jgi:hypothetical protein
MALAIWVKPALVSLMRNWLPRLAAIPSGDSVGGCVVGAGRKVKQVAIGQAKAAIGPPRVIHSLAAQPFARPRFTRKFVAMDGDRTASAMARIESALARIEAAAAARPAPSPDLQARYDALRQEASAALALIDNLIGGLER